MKIIILGAGQVGYNIAQYLSSNTNDIAIVDNDPKVIRNVADKLDIKPIIGFASHPNVLEEAGAKEANLLIAVTGSDEVNMIACEIAHALFHIETRIARVRHKSYLKEQYTNLFHPSYLAIDSIISPEIEVARSLSHSTRIPGAFEVIDCADGHLKIVGTRCLEKCGLINTPLRFFPTLLPYEIAILSINRQGKMIIPTSKESIESGDEVYFIAHSNHISEIMKRFGYPEEHKQQGIMIIGGGKIGIHLALEIEKYQPDRDIKIIEKDPGRAELAVKSLTRSEVFNGDALDYEVLKEGNIQECGTVVIVTNDDKVNILASLLVKRSGSNHLLTLLNNPSYGSFVTTLGIDAVINPRSITVSTILQHIRKGNLRAAHTLGNLPFEVIEVEAEETNNIIGLSVEDIKAEGGGSVTLPALIRGETIYIMPKNMIISAGDRLILSAKKDPLSKCINKLLGLSTYI